MSTLAATLASHAGATATYRRPGAAAVSLTVTISDPTSASEAAALGAVAGLDLTGLDIIIKSADLVIGGAKTTPALGDEIDVVVGTETRTFAVARGDGEAVFRYCDPLRELMRIHVEHVSTA